MEWFIYKMIIIDLLKNMLLFIDQRNAAIFAQLNYPEQEIPVALEYNSEQQKACLITKNGNKGSLFIINVTTPKIYRLPIEFPAPLQCAITSTFNFAYFIDDKSTLYCLDMTALTITPIGQPDDASCVGIAFADDKIYTAWETKENGSIAVLKTNGDFLAEYQLEGIPTNICIYQEKILVPFTESQVYGEGVAIFTEDSLPIYLSFQTPQSVKALRAYPCNITINPSTNTAYIINEDSSSLTMVDLTSNSISGAFSIGRSITNLYLLPNPNFAIATSNMFADLSVIDLVNQRLISMSNNDCEFANMLIILK
jgi:DNA-binding beta-propeller fold protein YncE